MIDGIPQVSDFDGEPGAPTCPKCGNVMDRGSARAEHALAYIPSQAPGWGQSSALEALSCIGCGYTELYTDPVEVRAILSGVKPPKPGKKPGLL